MISIGPNSFGNVILRSYTESRDVARKRDLRKNPSTLVPGTWLDLNTAISHNLEGARSNLSQGKIIMISSVRDFTT